MMRRVNWLDEETAVQPSMEAGYSSTWRAQLRRDDFKSYVPR